MNLQGMTARLAPWQTRLLTWSGLSLWASGTTWLLLHYFGQAKGEFGPQANPAEPWMMRLHGLVLLPALLGLGGLLVAHVPRGWKQRRQRVLGVALLSLYGILVLSGYLLYYVGDDGARSWVSLVHWAVGIGTPLPFAWHYLRGRRLHRSRAMASVPANPPLAVPQPMTAERPHAPAPVVLLDERRRDPSRHRSGRGTH